MFVFKKILRALFSCNTRFENRSFPLLPTAYKNEPFLLAFNFFGEVSFINVLGDSIHKVFQQFLHASESQAVIERNSVKYVF